MKRNANIEKETPSRKTEFLPNNRVISGEDLTALSDKEKAFARDCEEKGVWLEVFCPEDKCLLEEERIKLVDFCEDTGEKHDLWLKVFCPDASCEISEHTQLP